MFLIPLFYFEFWLELISWIQQNINNLFIQNCNHENQKERKVVPLQFRCSLYVFRFSFKGPSHFSCIAHINWLDLYNIENQWWSSPWPWWERYLRSYSHHKNADGIANIRPGSTPLKRIEKALYSLVVILSLMSYRQTSFRIQGSLRPWKISIFTIYPQRKKNRGENWLQQ